MDATYSLRQSPDQPSLWLVVEHFGQHDEPATGWTTQAKAETYKARLEAAAARRAHYVTEVDPPARTGSHPANFAD